MSMLKSHEFVTLVNNSNHTKVTPYLDVLVNVRKPDHFHENQTKVKKKIKY